MVIVASCKDDCFKNLSKKAKNWFRKLGSVSIDQVGYR